MEIEFLIGEKLASFLGWKILKKKKLWFGVSMVESKSDENICPYASSVNYEKRNLK